jgi:uncharacterized protein YhbP (UPF0306 family)
MYDTLTEALKLLNEHKTLTLATCIDGQPWAASLYYVSDDNLSLYFVSDPDTRHARELQANPDVAVTINADRHLWPRLRGLQIQGQAKTVSPEKRDTVQAFYLERFEEIAALFASPAGSQERKIAERLSSGTFFEIIPSRIRLIDNREGFGFREEFDI